MTTSHHHFELLHCIWLNEFINNLLDEHDKPIVFDSVEEALADLQDDFDTWAEEIRRGERERDEGFSPEEFLVRCVETDAPCELKLVGKKLVLISNGGRQLRSKRDFVRINRIGLF